MHYTEDENIWDTELQQGTSIDEMTLREATDLNFFLMVYKLGMAAYHWVGLP